MAHTKVADWQANVLQVLHRSMPLIGCCYWLCGIERMPHNRGIVGDAALPVLDTLLPLAELICSSSLLVRRGPDVLLVWACVEVAVTLACALVLDALLVLVW